MTDRRKWARYALYAAEVLLLFVIQNTPGLLPPIMGAKPVLLLAAALTISMVEDCVPAMAFGVFAGLLVDFGGGTALGYHALVYALLCFFLSGACGTRIQIQIFTAVLMGIWSCAAAVLLDWLVLYVWQGYSIPAYALLNSYLPMYFYTLLTVPLCYGLQWLLRRRFAGR